MSEIIIDNMERTMKREKYIIKGKTQISTTFLHGIILISVFILVVIVMFWLLYSLTFFK